MLVEDESTGVRNDENDPYVFVDKACIQEEPEDIQEEEEAGDPYVGMEFKSIDDAFNFYNMYGGKKGFSVRRQSRNSSKKGVTAVLFVCSKEGLSKRQKHEHKELGSSSKLPTPQKDQGSSRTDCKAYIRLKLVNEVIWQVTKFHDVHNHEFAPNTSSKRRRLRSLRFMTSNDEKIILDLNAQNVGPSKIMEYLSIQHGGKNNVSFTTKDVSNLIARDNAKLIGRDVETTLIYFRKKKEEDPEFFYAVDADEDGFLKHIFWVDGRARRAYLEFGDVVTFDTTYNTNKYSMPLAPFVGVNHHRQSIFFGMALLRSEGTCNFSWLFETWLKAMYDKHPLAIITDQDTAMKSAIKIVFPNTIHRCSMIEKYKLKDNNHLKNMYEKRVEWGPAYFRGIFFADMSTTQRSESVNALFKMWVNAHTSIYKFVMKIDSMIETIWQSEDDEDLKTMDKVPTLWSMYEFEKDAREVYTRNVFKKFKEFLYKSTRGGVIEKETHVLYEVNLKGGSRNCKESYVVSVNEKDCIFSCDCKGFEFEGLLCSHALKVMCNLEIEQLPSHYILKRWCKNANAEVKRPINDRSRDEGNSQALRMFRTATLHPKLNQIIELASNDVYAFKMVDDKLSELLSQFLAAQKGHGKKHEDFEQDRVATDVEEDMEVGEHSDEDIVDFEQVEGEDIERDNNAGEDSE
ncbi:hypothetical protein LUZ61_014429 [Rhynchospora tenuis]|uniref:SWIM-type domain-containing protein n=1 Tax=Rhynchospora tenuis TaxID=198213 RepID=A0AAD5Z159_9POAL|nr:hypothetical protein LUZ61_014429 [Rhynchospora tenuis]